MASLVLLTPEKPLNSHFPNVPKLSRDYKSRKDQSVCHSWTSAVCTPIAPCILMPLVVSLIALISASTTLVAAVRPELHLDPLQSSRRPSATDRGAARTMFE
jgi:hypothetical protein